MVAEFIHDCQRIRIASGRRDSCVLSCGPLTHEETAAAVIFVILVEIRNTTNLARTGIASVIKASVYYERSSHTCAESGAESLLVGAVLAETSHTESEAVAVVIHSDIYMVPVLQNILQMDFLPGRNSNHVIDYTLFSVDNGRDSNTYPVNILSHQGVNQAEQLLQYLTLAATGQSGFRNDPAYLPIGKDGRHTNIGSAKINSDSHNC